MKKQYPPANESACRHIKAGSEQLLSGMRIRISLVPGVKPEISLSFHRRVTGRGVIGRDTSR